MSSNLNYLTKTDYKLARECPTKLYYQRKRYPSTKDSNPYLELLKEGGHMVGEIARVIHPNGIFIGIEDDLDKSFRRTLKELEKENVTLFEAVFVQNGMLAVVDILEKKGTEINLIEVKSKSFDSNEDNQIFGKKGGISSKWQEYLEDVAFQCMVVENALTVPVTPYLLLPDKAKTTSIDQLASYFSISLNNSDRDKCRVSFSGDRSLLLNDHFLTRVIVKDAVAFLMPLVKQEAHRFLEMLNPILSRVQYHLGKHCKECEFRSDLMEQSGYHECWGELAEIKPHVFDLYYGGALKQDGKFLLDELISKRKVSLYDIPENAIKGKRGGRQSIQIKSTRENREWINPSFRNLLESYQYPLHFIDFETSVSAVPYHKGMRPYEQIAFQWSCHTIFNEGGEPEHSEWINLEDSFPSFKFAESLRKSISPEGTIFMWADHENTALKEIYRQMQDYGHDNAPLRDWLQSVIRNEDSNGRLVDLNKLCIENYFHPEMKGRTSIKYTLPAVWNNNPWLWELPFLHRLVKKDEHGAALSPYEALPDLEIDGVLKNVKEGVGAMIAYQEMMYGLSKDKPEVKTAWSKLLRQYCELDTLAMVIIFLHWRKLTGLNKEQYY